MGLTTGLTTVLNEQNTTEPSMCGGDVVLCQITLTTCFVSDSLLYARVVL